MKLYNLPRGSGKSTRACYISEFTNDTILVATREREEQLRQFAKDNHIKVGNIVCVSDFLTHQRGEKICTKNIIVDEMFDCFTEMIKQFGYNIEAITCTLE